MKTSEIIGSMERFKFSMFLTPRINYDYEVGTVVEDGVNDSRFVGALYKSVTAAVMDHFYGIIMIWSQP